MVTVRLLQLFLFLLTSSQQSKKVTAVTTEMNFDGEKKDASTPRTVVLSDKKEMPIIGLGVALSFENTYNAVHYALDEGYRLVDTAADETYDNQDAVGLSIKDWLQESAASTVSRNDIFITTKLWDSNHGFYNAVRGFYQSMKEFEHIDYVDLYLMHSPFGGRLIDTWDAILYLQQIGKVRSVGVSNFGIPHLRAIEESGRPLPVVNQIELHPLIYRKRLTLIRWCKEHNIQIQAYGSLMAGYENWLYSDFLTNIAKKYNKSSAQVLLKWAIQHGFCVIPKSIKIKRIRENINVFDFTLAERDMWKLDHWGDQLDDDSDALLYKEDWNWNPVDEARVHVGKKKMIDSFWARNFEDVDQSFIQDMIIALREGDEEVEEFFDDYMIEEL